MGRNLGPHGAGAQDGRPLNRPAHGHLSNHATDSGTGRITNNPMLGTSEQQSLITRLNRIEGQIRGIRRMVQEPRLCVEILQQLAAAEAALNRISLAVFKYHVDNCVTDGVSKGDPERRKQLTELVDIVDRFAR
jgi:CsoR family transcriptional regulator, copper-sensing transcriptional repressor